MSTLQVKNEAEINASVPSIWAVITDINQLTRLNAGAEKATGRMDKQEEIRIVEINMNGKKGTFTEKLVELVPEKKTVWVIENDTMGMCKMLKNNRFVTILETLPNTKTKVTNEIYYQPANLIAKIVSALMIKPAFKKMQEQILQNLKALTEK